MPVALSSVLAVFSLVRACFAWQSDRKSFGVGDYWEPFADRVRQGVVTRRDCDDFAMTVLLIGIEDHGWDKDKCRIARVLTEEGRDNQPFDHAVAIYDGWVIDNRARGPIRIEDCVYRFYDWCGVPMTDWYMYDTGQQYLKQGHW